MGSIGTRRRDFSAHPTLETKPDRLILAGPTVLRRRRLSQPVSESWMFAGRTPCSVDDKPRLPDRRRLPIAVIRRLSIRIAFALVSANLE